MIGTTVVQAKAWWQSKLILLGAAELLLGVAELISTTPILEGSTVAGVATTLAGLLTVVFRLFTTKPVASEAGPVHVSP